MTTTYDHEDFKLNEQQEAVLWWMNGMRKDSPDNWAVAYDLHRKHGYAESGKRVLIGDAGRRMRELRELGILESRKRGRFEEYRITSTIPAECPPNPRDDLHLSRKSTSATETLRPSVSQSEPSMSGEEKTRTKKLESASGGALFRPSMTKIEKPTSAKSKPFYSTH
jgi:hypothetical protein